MRRELAPLLREILDPPQNTVLEIDHFRFRLLSCIYRTSYLEIILTQIMKHELILIVLLQGQTVTV